MFGSRVGIAATLAVTVALLMASPASAHDAAASRSLVLQVDAQGVAGLWDVIERGKRASLQLAMVDLNRDGKLSGKEKAAVATALVYRGMAGVSVRLGSRPLRETAGMTARLVEDEQRNQSLEAVGLVSYEGGALQGPSQVIEVSVGEGYGALGLQVQTLGPWQVVGAEFTRLADDRRGLGAPQTIAPGGTLRFQIERGRELPRVGKATGGTR